MKLYTLVSAAFAAVVAAHDDAPTRPAHGLVGYGIPVFDPPCAFACRDSIAGATLNCSMEMEGHGMAGMDMGGMVMTEPDCYATDDVFLQTLALCIKTRCPNTPAWKLEKYWKDNVAGTLAVQPDPKKTYQQALDAVNGTPTAVYSETGPLNKTSIVDEALWTTNYQTDVIFAHQESMQEGFGLAIVLSGVAIPIGFSLLRFLPFPGALRSRFNAVIIDAPLIATQYHKLLPFSSVQALTRGQGLFILYFIIINVIFSAVGYQWRSDNAWYPDNRWRWMVMLVSNRLGLLSFANLPLVFLYAGRNNLLLWLTNWSHTTFLLLHRWIAAIATLQAILHSLIYLHAYVKAGTHAAESKLPYWYWGIIGTIGMTVLFPASISPIRRHAYELFLAWHVAISILIVVGCYYHIITEFQHSWGYETWIIVVMGIWVFDRIARFARLARYGVRRAEITVIDDEYVRVVIPSVALSGYAYLYFPTLTWRIWENHPFSVASTIRHPSSNAPKEAHVQALQDIEKQIKPSTTSLSSSSSPTTTTAPGSATSSISSATTFYIRAKTGTTSFLRSHTSLPVLLEAGYHTHTPHSLSTYPTLIALAGGVGITAVLPHLRSHPGRVKLYWGCRTTSLIDDVANSSALKGVEVETFVGGRMAVREVLERELDGVGKGGVAVLVSGPEGMSAEVRRVVAEVVREGKRVGVFVEEFGW